MALPIASTGFLAPDLSAKVGQLLSMAEAMGISMQIPGTSTNLANVWNSWDGFGNPPALSDASDQWNHIANQIGTALAELNGGANFALGRGYSPNDPTKQPTSAPSGDVWQGESATSFATYIGGLNPLISGLQQDAMMVAQGMSEASTSCYTLMAAVVAAFAALGTGGALLAGELVWALAAAVAGFTSFLIGKIIDNWDKFQKAKADIIAGRDRHGLQEDGQFTLPDGTSTVLPNGQYTPPAFPPGF